MNKIILAVLIIWLSASFGFSQNKVSARKNKVKVQKKTITSNSTVSDIGFGDIVPASINKQGQIFIGGRIRSEGLFIKILDRKLEINKIPFVYDLRKTFFTDEFNGWFSLNENLYQTTDGGANWLKIENVNINQQGVIFFLNERKGWVVGEEGNVETTDNAGKTWTKFEVAEFWTVKKMQFTNESNGWLTAYGDNAGFHHTTDGGKSWQKIQIADEEWISDFQFVDEFNGYAVDSSYRVLRTLDGGETWKVIKSSGKAVLGRVFFLNQRDGWIAGEKICRTSNAGEKWQCYSSPETNVNQIVFQNVNNGWLITGSSIYSTKDRGKTWVDESDVIKK